MNSSRVSVDISFVAHLADCLEGRVESDSVSATIIQLRSLVDEYKRKICLSQTVSVGIIPDSWFKNKEGEPDE